MDPPPLGVTIRSYLGRHVIMLTHVLHLGDFQGVTMWRAWVMISVRPLLMLLGSRKGCFGHEGGPLGALSKELGSRRNRDVAGGHYVARLGHDQCHCQAAHR